MMRFTLLMIALFAASYGNMDIPKRPEGIPILRLTNPKVRIDLWEDVLCSACAEFDQSFSNFFLKQTVNGKPIWEVVEIWIHQFPLPYHYNAFFATKPIPLVYSRTNYTNAPGLAVHDYMSWMFRNQDLFLSGASSMNEL